MYVGTVSGALPPGMRAKKGGESVSTLSSRVQIPLFWALNAFGEQLDKRMPLESFAEMIDDTNRPA
jgi:hypothetical protein